MKYKFEMVDETGSSRVLVETDSIYLDQILENFKSFLQASGFGINYDDTLEINYADSLVTTFTPEEVGDEVEESLEEVTKQVKSWFADFPTVDTPKETGNVRITVDSTMRTLGEKIQHTKLASSRGVRILYSSENGTHTYIGPLEGVKEMLEFHYGQGLTSGACSRLVRFYHPELFGV
jgi:hypothetical protein